MEQKYIISLSLKELEIIGTGLQGVAFQYAAPLIKNIEEQVNTQMQVQIPKEVPQETVGE